VVLAVQSRDGDPAIWTHDLERGTFTRLNIDIGAWWPQWTPDGRHLTFQTLADDVMSTILKVPADGSGSPERLFQNIYPQQATDWLPDGRTLIVQQNDHPDTKWDVLMATPGEDSEATPLLHSPFMEMLAELSPDGKWIAYASDESGQFEVYVRSFPDLGSKWQISTGGGIEPAWSQDGTELFYRNEHGSRLMVVDVILEPEFQPGQPRLLFEGSFVQTPWYGRNYDIAPDGQSFLLLRQNLGGIDEAKVRVVVNWGKELEQSVPATR
jgi:Tol biopolymer transport system component